MANREYMTVGCCSSSVCKYLCESADVFIKIGSCCKSKFTQPTHTHPFNGPFSGTTQVSRYQKGITNLDFIEARDSEWQWHQLRHMQVCTSLQTDNHASTPPLCFYRPDALPAAQPTASKHNQTGDNIPQLTRLVCVHSTV